MSYLNETHWCGAKPGEPHKDWDDVARCYISGQQLIACGDYWLVDEYDNETPNPDHQCHPSIWDGDYPGVKQCQKYGLYTTGVVGIDGPTEDLSALSVYGTWDIETQQHVIGPKVLEFLLKKQKKVLDKPKTV